LGGFSSMMERQPRSYLMVGGVPGHFEHYLSWLPCWASIFLAEFYLNGARDRSTLYAVGGYPLTPLAHRRWCRQVWLRRMPHSKVNTMSLHLF